jgi:hypothetical protein
MVWIYVVVLIIPISLAFFSLMRLLGVVRAAEYETGRELI